MSALEQTRVRIGFIRLVDCVTIAAAKVRGEFEAEGLDVVLTRHESWAAVRDQLAYGEIDAAHLLSPMVVASAAGLGPFPNQLRTSFAINLNGNAITVSHALADEMDAFTGDGGAGPVRLARQIKAVVESRRRAGGDMLTLAVVYPFSMHNYELRYWLAAGGVHPDADVRIVVVPPSRMVETLMSGAIDGYCVGEPWNSEAVHAGLGRVLVTSAEIWSNGPEKVLGVRRDWADANPATHEALIRALLRASIWVDQPENREEAAKIAAGEAFVDLPAGRLACALTRAPDFNVFHRHAANFPWRSHAAWIAAQMMRWGQAPETADIASIAEAAFDPAPYRVAAAALGVAAPLVDYKAEGAHEAPWMLDGASAPIAMGADQLLDGRVFRIEDGPATADAFGIHSMRKAPAGVFSA